MEASPEARSNNDIECITDSCESRLLVTGVRYFKAASILNNKIVASSAKNVEDRRF